jgi:hypothetical protein
VPDKKYQVREDSFGGTSIMHNISEAMIQADICKYLQSKKIFHHSVPNEGAGAGSGAAMRTMQLITMGLKPGVADLIVWWPWGIGYVEVKTPVGVQSEAQKKFQARCIDHGIPYILVRSVSDVERYLVSGGTAPSLTVTTHRRFSR